jgi:hypothetical protein
MELTDNTHCVAVFDRHEDAEKAMLMGTLEGAAVGAALGGGTTALAAALSGTAMGQVQVHAS